MTTNKLTLLPPDPSVCQQCGVDHEPEQPHDATSMFYGFWYLENHGRSPTWADAMAHCDAHIKDHWLEYLQALGIDPNSTKVRGEVTSQKQVDDALGKVSIGG